jgi:hypothetical protein
MFMPFVPDTREASPETAISLSREGGEAAAATSNRE